MKIMLIQAEPPDDIQDFNFPMGYAALDSVLSQAGHEVRIVSTVAYHLLDKDIAARILDFKPHLVGIGGMWPYLPRVEMLVRLVRDTWPQARIVLGGWMVTYLPQLVLRKAQPDFCIAGEGEWAMLKLANALADGGDYSQIPGVSFREGDRTIDNGMGELYPLDQLPMPNWEKFPMEYYLRVGWYFNSFCTGYDRVMGWAVSRGCPGKCNFCTPGAALRYKPMDLLMDELHQIEDRFHPTFMYWMDNLTMGSIAQGKKFAQRLIDEKFKWRYFLTGRVDRVDRELMAILKESGCACILYGLESANNDMLKAMGKNTTVEEFVEAVKITKEAGIGVNISGMFGQPGETLDDFYKTLRLIMTSTDRRMPFSNNQGFYPLTTFPGAPIYDWAAENGYFSSDDEFYDKFFKDRWINYTDYSDEIVIQALNVANLMNTWNFHHSKALSLEDALAGMQSLRTAKVSPAAVAYRVKTRLDARPALKARVRAVLEHCPPLLRLARRLLQRGAQAPVPPPEPAAGQAARIDPAWPAEKQLDEFIARVVRDYLDGAAAPAP
ncbi:MAG: B12-binding domain-containing radical SAM protein [Planctomycetaceae bacterium]|nr:B12-binding domain-containing radical SAM protein [Planctomycetaceae bacterium]